MDFTKIEGHSEKNYIEFIYMNNKVKCTRNNDRSLKIETTQIKNRYHMADRVIIPISFQFFISFSIGSLLISILVLLAIYIFGLAIYRSGGTVQLYPIMTL